MNTAVSNKASKSHDKSKQTAHPVGSTFKIYPDSHQFSTSIVLPTASNTRQL